MNKAIRGIPDRSPILALTAAFVLFWAVPLAAQSPRDDVLIQGGHSGAWYDINQPGHGLFVEVLQDAGSPTNRSLFVAWFAFFNGQAIWLIGQGDVVQVGAGFEAQLDVYQYTGNDFPPRYDHSKTTSKDWGQITLTFSGCDQAYLHWDSSVQGYGSGDLALRRLTTIADSKCVPDLGGEEKLDDHGDSWETGTYLPQPDASIQTVEGELEQKGDVDVFVFSLKSSHVFNAYTLGGDNPDTVGTLYKIVDYDEVKVATDDNGSHFGGFQINELITAGTYSLHVEGKGGQVTGKYVLYFKATGG